MVAPQKKEIQTTLGDLERAKRAGAPRRDLYKIVSKINDNLGDSSTAETVREGLREEAVKIHESGCGK